MKLLNAIECIVQDSTKKIVSDDFAGFIYYDTKYRKIVTNTGTDFFLSDKMLSGDWKVESLTNVDFEDGLIVDYINKTLGSNYQTIDDVYICDIIESQVDELSEKFLNTILDYYGGDEDIYDSIIEYQQVSETFLRKHCQHPCFNDDIWSNVGYSQKLSEKFMSDFCDKLDWYWISQKQDFSQEFALKYRDKINWEEVIKRQMFPVDFYLKNFHLVDMRDLKYLIDEYGEFRTLVYTLIEKYTNETNNCK